MENITIAIKREVVNKCLHLTWNTAKGQGQAHAHFDCEYLGISRKR